MKLKSLSEEYPQHNEQGFPQGYLIRGPVVGQKEKAGRTGGGGPLCLCDPSSALRSTARQKPGPVE